MVDASPVVLENAKISPPTPAIKIATPDIMIGRDDPMPIEIMSDLIFENIGGQEIISMARTDLVNGQNIAYTPIANLSGINSQYNSNNIISLDNTLETVFKNFSIKLDPHVPTVGNGPNGVPVYIDSSGNLVVEAVNMATGEQIEIQIMTAGNLLDGTIYI